MAIVTLDEAKQHLRVVDSTDDDLISRLCDEATDIIVDYLKLPEGSYQATSGEPDADLPPRVRSAALLVLDALYDNADGDDTHKQPLSQAVKDLLRRTRDPALA